TYADELSFAPGCKLAGTSRWRPLEERHLEPGTPEYDDAQGRPPSNSAGTAP
ncbi:MAG: hypothetical protein HOY71_28620, partial [Nonomuraea sp.]|nr:hypothetical protein [Nonomuraea sp.]